MTREAWVAYKSIKYELCNLKAECTNLAKEFSCNVVNCSQNGQLGLYQNPCTFQEIHSLSTGGVNSRVLAYIASPTFPYYVDTHCSVPHTATVEMSCQQHNCSTNVKLCILVKAQPSTPSTWPLSPTRLGIRP